MPRHSLEMSVCGMSRRCAIPQLVPEMAIIDSQRQDAPFAKSPKGDSFAFLGFDFRRVKNRSKTGYFILMTPKQKARQAIEARIRDVVQHRGAKPAKDIVNEVNAILAGWVNYFRVGNSSRAFGEIRDYTEMKLRTLLTRRKRRKKRSIGWRRWSNEYLYGVLGLYWDWKVHPLKGADGYR